MSVRLESLGRPALNQDSVNRVLEAVESDPELRKAVIAGLRSDPQRTLGQVFDLRSSRWGAALLRTDVRQLGYVLTPIADDLEGGIGVGVVVGDIPPAEIGCKFKRTTTEEDLPGGGKKRQTITEIGLDA